MLFRSFLYPLFNCFLLVRMNFVCLSKETNQRKDTTPKNTAILLSHHQTALVAMQNFVFAQGVDFPRTINCIFMS
jgi:hypothetical protein